MLNNYRRNKLFLILLVVSLVVFILAIFLTSVISLDVRDEIHQKVINIYKNQDNQIKILTKNNLQTSLIQNTVFFVVCWLLGISIIGIPIILFIYFLKLLLFAWNCYFLIAHIKIQVIPFLILYLFSSFIFLILYFITVYYAISYSIILINTIIFKKNYHLQKITNNYIKILIISLLLSTLFSFMEVYIIPKILLFF